MRIQFNRAFEYYQKGVYPMYEKVYAIGDIHGDYEAFTQVLRKAKLIDTNDNWIGGTSHVVQIGDILDRRTRMNDRTDEDSEFKIIALILKLQLESYETGGGFHPVMGNHELMNIMGDFEYVSPMGMKHFKTKEERLKYFEIGNDFCKYMACGWNPVVKIGHLLFCHGGISYAVSQKYSIYEINMIMRDTLYGNREHMLKPYFQELFLNPTSILWNRQYSNDEIKEYTKKKLDKIFETYKIHYMIVGHTPQMNGIVLKQNRVFCIDTGMSESFGKKKNKSERIHYLLFDSKKNRFFSY